MASVRKCSRMTAHDQRIQVRQSYASCMLNTLLNRQAYAKMSIYVDFDCKWCILNQFRPSTKS